MLTGIDHVLIACADPDAAAAELEAALGLRATAGGRHEEPGTFNRLIFVGDSYIELMGVWDGDRALRSWWGRHAVAVLAAAAAAGRAAGYMGVVMHSDDLATDSALVRAQGSALGAPEDGSRTRPDGRTVRWQVAHAAKPDADLGVLFMIEHDRTAAEWTPDEVAERRAYRHPAGGSATLVRVEVPVAAMRDAMMRVHRDIGIGFRPSLAGGGARDATIGRQTLRLLHGGQDVLPAIVLNLEGVDDAREVDLLGCRWVVG